MGIITRAKKRRLEQEKLRVDLISSLPDGVLGDIVSLLPTEDGARTQVLSSRWRHLWRSAPLNLDLHNDSVDIHPSDISRVLSVHPGPGRRFVMPRRYSTEYPTTTTLDGWLRSHALDNLPELEFSLRNSTTSPLVVHRFSSTLCIARFFGCRFIIPAANYASPLQWPRLKELTLFHVSISERCLPTFLTGCPVLESLALLHSSGFPRLLIGSSSIRSIGVHPSYIHPGSIQRLIIEDAPCLEIYFGGISINISVISAPRLAIFGNLFHGFPTLQFVASVLKGSTVASMSAGVVSSVKVLALHDIKLSVDMVINLLRCLPQLQKLYIQTTRSLGKDWYTYQNHTSTVDIDVKKNVLRNYRGNKSHINLACFFISNAQVLESMRFEIEATNVSTKWIRRQQRLLQINKRASRRTQFDFVSNITRGCIDDRRAQQVHDLSADPFHRKETDTLPSKNSCPNKIF